MSKHTPEPWGYIKKKGPRTVLLKREHWSIGSNPTNEGVAFVFGDTDANARLIAAAPDMLAALVRVVSESDWRSLKDGGGWVVPDDRLAQVCAVIRKAEGEPMSETETAAEQARREFAEAFETAAERDRLRESNSDLLEALKAIGVFPWGYCFCPPSMGDMEEKPDDAHCGECREARLAIREAEGEPMENDISITKRVTIKELEEYVLGIRPSAERLAGRLLSELWLKFEELENDGVEFECLELTATFKPRETSE